MQELVLLFENFTRDVQKYLASSIGTYMRNFIRFSVFMGRTGYVLRDKGKQRGGEVQSTISVS